MDDTKENTIIEMVEIGCTNCHGFEIVNNIFAKTLTIHKKRCGITKGCNGTLYITKKKINKELTRQAKTEDQTKLIDEALDEKFEEVLG